MDFQEQSSAVVEWVAASLLKAHPKNESIYGTDGFQDLVESIRELGVLQAIYARPDNTVISGHRRWRAALECGKPVPVIRVKYPSSFDELQAIIEHNRYRIKNGQQLYNEGKELEGIEKVKARERQKGGRGGVLLTENFPEAKGESRDRVAKTIGLGSGKQWDSLKAIGESKPELLADIKPGGITIRKATQLIQRETRLNKARHDMAFPTGKYSVLYVDPPWHYRNDGFSGGADAQYPTMTTEQLEGVNLLSIAETNCVLFLWSTNPHLAEAIHLLETWGFEYKTNIVWVKESDRIGFYVKARHELLLIATCGGNLEPYGEKPSSVIFADRAGHSEKPLEAYDVIEAMYPDATKCELFARNKRVGWESWGNELE